MITQVSNPDDFCEVFTSNFNSRRLEELVSNYTRDAVMDLGDGNVFTGREQIKEALTNFLAPGLPIQTTLIKTLVSGDTAFVTFDFEIGRTDSDRDDEQRSISGRAIDVLRLEADGHWRQCIDLPFGVASKPEEEQKTQVNV